MLPGKQRSGVGKALIISVINESKRHGINVALANDAGKLLCFSATCLPSFLLIT